MEQQNLFTNLPVPPRLPKMVIPREARQPVIDYFAVLATQHEENSYEGSRIQYVLRSLQRADDPIEDIMRTGRQQMHHSQAEIHPFYQTALEMLYVIRHRLETEYMLQQTLSSGEVAEDGDAGANRATRIANLQTFPWDRMSDEFLGLLYQFMKSQGFDAVK